MGPAVNPTTKASPPPELTPELTAEAEKRSCDAVVGAPHAASSAGDATNPCPDARQRVELYLRDLGMTPAPAATVAATLDRRIDPELTDPTRRAVAMLEAFDRWTDQLPEALGLSSQAGRVAFALSRELGPWLSEAPQAFDEPTVLIGRIKKHLDAWPGGLLPALPHQTMHRQPLGDLPKVLRGAFWSGTYRWVMPNANPDAVPQK